MLQEGRQTREHGGSSDQMQASKHGPTERFMTSSRGPLPEGPNDMDDSFVFATKKIYSQTDCAKLTAIYDGNGHCRINRVPRGKPPVVQAFGIMWLVLLEDRYILTGAELSKRFPYFLFRGRIPARALGESPIKVGFITTPQDWTHDDYQLVEYLQYVDGHEDPDTSDKAHTTWCAQSKMRLTQMRTDFQALVIVPPPKAGGQPTAVRMCDLPDFALFCGDPSTHPKTTKLKPSDCDNYAIIKERWVEEYGDFDEEEEEGVKPPRRPTRDPKPIKPRPTMKPIAPKKPTKVTKPTKGGSKDTLAKRIRDRMTDPVITFPLPQADIQDALTRELLRNMVHSENYDFMQKLGELTLLRNSLVNYLVNDTDDEKIRACIADFQLLTAQAANAIQVRAKNNRRGVAAAHDYLISLQFDSIQTGDELQYREENLIISSDPNRFLRQYTANTPAKLLQKRLRDVLTGTKALPDGSTEDSSEQEE